MKAKTQNPERLTKRLDAIEALLRATADYLERRLAHDSQLRSAIDTKRRVSK
jgi:hypothetical protein